MSSQYQAFTEIIQGTTTSNLTTTFLLLDTYLTLSNAATLSLTEWVKIDLIASDTTLAFQTRFESDFAQSEAIFRQCGLPHDLGEGGLPVGWAEEHEGVRSFMVSREWEKMSDFEHAVETKSFKEGVGILIGWGVPFNL
ncbi:hypothetical protein SVAN01_11717 [Stagonosporopsis vannaccii]|nr:hypothetical protein SVAN01_11717 [Stagonosporopsis vannaccii]